MKFETSAFENKNIQICGISCRLPGARNVDEFRSVLFDGRCVVTSIPEERWKHWPFYHDVVGKAGRAYTFAAGVLDDIWGFDPKVFNISPREAASMDPQQRLLLHLVWEALEDAGLVPGAIAGSNVGVYAGVSSTDYSRRLAIDPVGTSDPYVMTGNALSIVANRVSHVFDLRGPSMTIDTACSSSLVALDRACCDLSSGRIDTAIVGGVNILASPDQFGGFSVANMLSKTGLCQSFGSGADGYVRAEGGVALVLQTQEAAQASRSTSRGSIVASLTNSDGWTPGISLPSQKAQAALLQDIYHEAGVDPEALLFIEAHGTGTFVGDPIEASALGEAVGRRRSNPLHIGSVKSNIGHLEPASGLAGVLKAVLALEENKFPATLHAEEPNPDIDFQDLNLELAQDLIELPKEPGKNLAGINSFGFGGMNAHAVISRSAERIDAEKASYPSNGILTVSSYCDQSLGSLLSDYRQRLQSGDETVANEICNNAFYHRGKLPVRAAVLGNSGTEMSEVITDHLKGRNPEGMILTESSLADQLPVFVYSGNGSQYAGMCMAALSSDEAYARHFAEIDEQFEKLSGWRMLELLKDPALAGKLGIAEYAQPLLFADQVALTRALADRGLKPAAVVGHSGGEISAACCSGAMPLDQALRTIIERSNCQQELHGLGTMAAVQAAAEDIEDALSEFGNPSITIAAINSPKSVTIVGPRELLAEFLIWIRRNKRWAGVKLDVDYPYHSPFQDRVEDQFRQGLKYLKPQTGDIPFYSSVAGKLMNGLELTVDYWWSLIRNPVRFNDAIDRICEDGFRVFVECGAQPVLLSYIKDCVSAHDGEFAILPSFDKKDGSSISPVDKTLCRAVLNGAVADVSKIFGEPANYKRQLPTYPWQNQEYRNDRTPEIESFYGLSDGSSALLGQRANTASNCWISAIDANLTPDLSEHVIGGTSILPGTGFLEAALCAASEVLNTEQVEIRNMDIFSPLGITSGSISQLRTAVSEETLSLVISSRGMEEQVRWQEHARCRFGTVSSKLRPRELAAPDRNDSELNENGDILYEYGKLVGLDYGEAFQRVSQFRQINPTTVDVFLKDPDNFPLDKNYRCLAPPAADAVLHGLLALLFRSNEFPDGLGFVPVFLKRLRLLKPGVPISSGRVEVSQVGQRSILADCTYFDAQGEPIAEFEGIRLRAIKLLESASMEHHVLRTELKPVALAEGSKQHDMLSVSEVGDLISGLANSAEFFPEDDSHFIVEAIAKAIAHECASGFCDKHGVFKSPVTEKEIKGYSVSDALLKILVSSNLASEEDGTIKIASDTGLPPSDELIGGLLADNPERVAECRMMTRIRSALPGLMTGKVDVDAEKLLGRNNLVGFENFSQSAKRRHKLLENLIAAIANDDTGKVRPKVLVVTDNSHLELSLESGQLAHECELKVLTPNEIESGPSFENLAAKLAVDPSGTGEFDLVAIHSGVVREGPSEHTVANASRLVVPGGLLIMSQSPHTSFGELVNCVLGEGASPKTKPSEAIYNNERWEAETAELGLGNCAVVTLPENFSGLSYFVAKRPHDALMRVNGTATCISEKSDEVFVKAFANTLRDDISSGSVSEPVWHEECQGYSFSVERGSPEEGLSVSEWLYLARINDISQAQNLLAERMQFFAGFFEGLGEEITEVRILLPHGANHERAADISPSQSAIWNMIRTARNEYPHISIVTIDPGPATGEGRLPPGIIKQMLSLNDETELVIESQGISALRVKRGLNTSITPQDINANSENLNASLSVPLSGRIPELEWAVSSRKQPEPNEVEIRVDATGLNYRDVMWGMGLLPEEALENGFAGASVGMECAGTVTKVGDKVEGISLGDQVMAVGSACFSSFVTLDAAYCFPLPDSIDIRSAAAMPVTFFTAYYSLVQAARMQPGEKVLIHGAAGGVGLAAIQIAQLKGATVFATAGSPDKRDLLRTLGVSQIFDSRSLSFEDEVMAATEGQGVDIVLNSLAGNAMERSLGLLKAFGRFVELGKQDFYANTKIGLRPFRENIEYLSVDVDQLLSVKPKLTNEIFRQIIKHFEDGDIRPIPYYHFDSNNVVEAFKFMQRSAHVGKIIVSPPKPETAKMNVNHTRFTASSHGAHIIAGGAGGLGFETAKWLAYHGAQHLYLLGRKKALPKSMSKEIRQISQFGCSVNYVQCDISDRISVDKVLAEIRSELPISSVFNAAMHLEDVPLRELDNKKIRSTLASKVAGSVNLSEATIKDDLDYFVLYSSLATLVGNQRQAAYVAANAYIDALVRNRNNAGLPGLAVGWGAISDVGYLSENKVAAEIINKVSGGIQFTSKQALDWLGKVLSTPQALQANPVVTVTNINLSNMAGQLATIKTPMFESFRSNEGEDAGISDKQDLRTELEKLPADKAEKQLARFIQEEISKILRIQKEEVNIEKPMTDLGMDSLMGVEFGMAAQQSLGDDIPLVSISDGASIKEVAARIIRHINTSAGGAKPSGDVLENLVSQHSGSRKDVGVNAGKLRSKLSKDNTGPGTRAQ